MTTHRPRLAIIWTKHAIDRVSERFGFDREIEIPNRTIANVGRLVEVGSVYKIRRGVVTYVCQRSDEAAVKIVTVFNNQIPKVMRAPSNGQT